MLRSAASVTMPFVAAETRRHERRRKAMDVHPSWAQQTLERIRISLEGAAVTSSSMTTSRPSVEARTRIDTAPTHGGRWRRKAQCPRSRQA
jgi:hypothetical protein